jgi:acetoin utilization protein AcuB
MKSIPAVQKYMTTSPHTIGSDQPVDKAMELMKKYKIRHLPVLDAGKLVGVVTDRDLKFYLSFAGTDPASDKVAELVDPEVFQVTPASSIDEVAAEMAERKLGSAIVMDNKKVVGIFTTVDALRALSEVFSTRLKRVDHGTRA